MPYLNTTDDYRQEYEMIAGPDIHHIEIMCKKHGRYYLPSESGDKLLWADFRTMTVEGYWMVDSLTSGKEDSRYEDFSKLFIKFQLVDWNLDVPLEFDENGWLTDVCWNTVLSLPFPLIEAFALGYQNTFEIDKEEEILIDKQCGILFSKSARGVDNACNAVSMFCVLGNMWDKFGLNRFDLKNMSYKEFKQIRIVLSKEIDKQRSNANVAKRQGQTKIAGAGGRTRSSRGVSIENP